MAGQAGTIWAMGGDDFGGVWKGALVGGTMGFMASEQFGNFVKGKGFNNDNTVFEDFKSGLYTEAGGVWQQDYLDYKGLSGKYDPDHPAFESMAGAPGHTDEITGEVFYNSTAFEKGSDKVYATYLHEMRHRSDVLAGKISIGDNKTFFESEHGAYKVTYRNQGLYPDYNKSDIWIKQINRYGMNAQMPKYIENDFIFTERWWHKVYTLQRYKWLW